MCRVFIPGQTVTILDDDHNSPCGAYALSDLADTIVYEIITCVHEHVDADRTLN